MSNARKARPVRRTIAMVAAGCSALAISGIASAPAGALAPGNARTYYACMVRTSTAVVATTIRYQRIPVCPSTQRVVSWAARGPVGPQGPQGLPGATGAVGATGADGAAGATGADGLAGATGAAGAQGATGADGSTGADGAQGATGADGVAGADGATGPAGPEGPQGPQGLVGPQGATGAAGPVGPQGPQGLAGVDGTNGTDGAAGSAGATGDTGPQGPAGPQGVAGPTGPTGATGSVASRAGTNVSATETAVGSNIFQYVYASALPAGTYAANVQLQGAQNPGFTGNTTMPGIVVLSSSNTTLTFQFVNYNGGAVLNPTPTAFTIDFIVAAQSA